MLHRNSAGIDHHTQRHFNDWAASLSGAGHPVPTPFDSSHLETSPVRALPHQRHPPQSYAELYAKRVGHGVGPGPGAAAPRGNPVEPGYSNGGASRHPYYEQQPQAYYQEPAARSAQEPWNAPPSSSVSPSLAAIRRAAAPFQHPAGPRAAPAPPQPAAPMGPPPSFHRSGAPAPSYGASIPDRPAPQPPRQARPEPSHAPEPPVFESPLELIRRRAAGVLGTLPADGTATPAVSEWLQRHGGRPQAPPAPAASAAAPGDPYRPNPGLGAGPAPPHSYAPPQPLSRPREEPSPGSSTSSSHKAKNLERELVRGFSGNARELLLAFFVAAFCVA